MKIIEPDEVEIIGSYLVEHGRIIGDEDCQRINDLIANHLFKLGNDKSGWDTLFRDPNDGRLWELIYQESDMHGGGPPQLRFITLDEARGKYEYIV